MTTTTTTTTTNAAPNSPQRDATIRKNINLCKALLPNALLTLKSEVYKGYSLAITDLDVQKRNASNKVTVMTRFVDGGSDIDKTEERPLHENIQKIYSFAKVDLKSSNAKKTVGVTLGDGVWIQLHEIIPPAFLGGPKSKGLVTSIGKQWEIVLGDAAESIGDTVPAILFDRIKRAPPPAPVATKNIKRKRSVNAPLQQVSKRQRLMNKLDSVDVDLIDYLLSTDSYRAKKQEHITNNDASIKRVMGSFH